MLTVDEFLRYSQKARLIHIWNKHTELAKQASEESAAAIHRALQSHRHPDTIFGFMTKEQADEQIAYALAHRSLDLMIERGLVVFRDTAAFFLADDNQLGYSVLPKAFRATAYEIPLRTISQVRATTDVFCTETFPGLQYLDSPEAVVKYVNDNYPPERFA